MYFLPPFLPSSNRIAWTFSLSLIRFLQARLMPPPEKPTSPLLTPGPSSSSRFPLRSAMHQHQQNQQAALLTPTSPSPSTPGPGPYSFSKLDTGQLRIRTLRFGSFDISTWYDAPFPEEFSNIPDGRLWMCEFCLKYMKSRFGAQRHRVSVHSLSRLWLFFGVRY